MWACASVLWADDVLLAIRRVIVLLVLGVAAVGMSRRTSVTQFAWVVFFSCGLYLAAGIGTEVVLETFAPSEEGYRFAGTLHPNHQAINCAALALASLHLYNVNARFTGQPKIGDAVEGGITRSATVA